MSLLEKLKLQNKTGKYSRKRTTIEVIASCRQQNQANSWYGEDLVGTIAKLDSTVTQNSTNSLKSDSGKQD